MKIKDYLKEVYSNFIKSELTDTLMEKTDVSYKCRELYDEALIAKTISVFELHEIIPEFPKCCKAIHITASYHKLLKILHSVITTTHEKPTGMYLLWELPSEVYLEEAAQLFADFEDICDEKYKSDDETCHLMYTSRFNHLRKAKVTMLLFYK